MLLQTPNIPALNLRILGKYPLLRHCTLGELMKKILCCFILLCAKKIK
jgi:hypothetical protein